jgi:glycopeptide antibiotics resistance protein
MVVFWTKPKNKRLGMIFIINDLSLNTMTIIIGYGGYSLGDNLKKIIKGERYARKKRNKSNKTRHIY